MESKVIENLLWNNDDVKNEILEDDYDHNP